MANSAQIIPAINDADSRKSEADDAAKPISSEEDNFRNKNKERERERAGKKRRQLVAWIDNGMNGQYEIHSVYSVSTVKSEVG